MNKTCNSKFGRIKLISFAVAALLHIVLIMFVSFRAETTQMLMEPIAGVMRLVDLQEYVPPPPAPEILFNENEINTQDLTAAIIIEIDELLPTDTAPVYAPVNVPAGSSITASVHGRTGTEEIIFLPQHRITLLPVLPEAEIRRNIVYPPLAQRSGIEGIVFLELLIDQRGNITEIIVLRENPPGRGFAEAAVNAFYGVRATRPAELNGQAVAVRFRYPINFALR